MNYFVTAIGTDSGKTVISSILTEYLQADYWKPIQAGYPRDTETVQSLISNYKSFFHPEKYLLNTPVSPHASAAIDDVRISLEDFNVPETSRDLVMEGAGGLMVPINDEDYVIDIAAKLPCEIILVCNLYLGSINHSLLSIHYLKSLGLPVKGIIFNGTPNIESELIILKKSPWPCLLKVSEEKKIEKNSIKKYAEELDKNWNA